MEDKTSNGRELMKNFLLFPEDLDDQTKQEIAKFYDARGRQWIYEQLKEMRILPFGAHTLMTLNRERDYWMQIHELYIARNRIIYEVLDKLFAGFEASNISYPAVYENFGVILRSNSCVGCFASGDIDLTTDLEHRDKFDKVMNNNGFKEITRRNHVSSRIVTNYYNESITKDGFWINLTWKPIARRFVNNHNRLAERLAEARRTAQPIEGTNIRALNSDELMYFSILHIALGHYYTNSPGIRLYVDVDRLARACNVNWKRIRKWAEEDDMGIRVDAVMEISNLLLKTPYNDRRSLHSNEKKSFEKLMRYVYDKSTGELILRSSILEKMHVDLLSDGKNLLSSVIGRIV